MDMAFATSLGIGEAGLKALMRDAGFRAADAPAEVEEVAESIVEIESIEAEEASAETSEVADGVQPVAETAGAQPVVLTHWRWIGLPKARPQEQREPRPRSGKPPRKASNSAAKPDRAPPPPRTPSPPSELALQLAALKGLKL